MQKKNLRLNFLDNSVIDRHSRRLYAEIESLHAVMRHPVKDFHAPVMDPLRGFALIWSEQQILSGGFTLR